jgi:16S rRNA (guanine527-N7)-methyltransferase
MPILSESAIAVLLAPYLPDAPATLLSRLSLYLDLLLKWNARTNLTAIRDPEEIVRRHFGESIFAARHLDPDTPTLLDFGSGAGFPGIPIALLRSKIQVTLAESQNKKASFLREIVRTLNLSAQVWPNRVESMPPDRRFHIVTLRAVDNMDAALPVAEARVVPGGQLVLLTTTTHSPAGGNSIPLPNSTSGVLYLRTPHEKHSLFPQSRLP